MKELYVLSKDGQTPIQFHGSPGEHFNLVEDDPNRYVADEDVLGADINVWTYFVGLGYCMWETMATQNGADPYWGYDKCIGDRDDAIEMHKAMVERVIVNKRPNVPTIPVTLSKDGSRFERDTSRPIEEGGDD